MNRSRLVTILTAAALLSLPGVSFPRYSGGTGEPNDPYRIATPNDLKDIGNHVEDWDRDFLVVADLNMAAYSGDTYNVIGTDFYDPFTGVFDGGGHSIFDFSYDSNDDDYVGIFGCVSGSAAEVRNLAIIGPNITAGGGSYVGPVAGYAYEASIRNCAVENCIVVGDGYVGGLVSAVSHGALTGCSVSAGSVYGQEWAGGLSGRSDYTDLFNCDVSSDVVGGYYVGGMSGGSIGSALSDCCSSGTAVGNEYIGGLIGYGGYGEISDSNSDSDVNGVGNVGGLAGYYRLGPIADCYATGRITGDCNVGGLIGRNDGEAITRCYANGNVAGTDRVGGLLGDNLGQALLESCFALGSVAGTNDVGGLVGRSVGSTIFNCYAQGDVTGVDRVGGLAGTSSSRSGFGPYDMPIVYCHSSGAVSAGSNVGGLVGRFSGKAMSSYWDSEKSGQETSPAGTKKTTVQMQTGNTFIGWGCDSAWTIDLGNDYPRLAWENKIGSVIGDHNYGGGSGTAEDPFLIYTAQQLNTIGQVLCHTEKNFMLMADIDLSIYEESEFNLIGHDFYHAFRGTFDGNDHTIANFNYSITDTNVVGLFRYKSGPGLITNLGLIDPNVDAGNGSQIGALIGSGWQRLANNCWIDGGKVQGFDYVGGLIGRCALSYRQLTNCYVNCQVSGHNYVGGLAGIIDGGYAAEIADCGSGSYVSGLWYVGGFAGGNLNCIVSKCYSSGPVSGSHYVGGLVVLCPF